MFPGPRVGSVSGIPTRSRFITATPTDHLLLHRPRASLPRRRVYHHSHAHSDEGSGHRMAGGETHACANQSTCDGCAPRHGGDGHEDCKEAHRSDHRPVLCKCDVALSPMPASLFLVSVGLEPPASTGRNIELAKEFRRLFHFMCHRRAFYS